MQRMQARHGLPPPRGAGMGMAMRIVYTLAAIGLAFLLSGPAMAQLVMADGSVLSREEIAKAATGCAAGQAQDCLIFGLAARSGAGRQVNIDEAAAALRKACEGGLGMGCAGEAEIAALRRDRRKDPKFAAERWAKARGLFTAACDQGSAIACHALADMLVNTPAMSDTPRAAMLYAKACFDLKFGPSCLQGAALTGLSSAPAHDLALAQRFEAALDPALDAECQQGRPGACAALGEWLISRPGPSDKVRIAALADTACSNGAGHGCALAADLIRRDDRSAEGWDRQIEYLDRACALQFARCAQLAEAMRAHPPIRTLDSGLLFLADIKACLGDVQEHCWRLYEPAARLNAAELEQLVMTFDQACLNLPRPSAELCAAAASNHVERAEAMAASASADRAEARRLYQRALELPEDAEDNATAHAEARAFLAGA